ncbi:MAG: UvrD-helicase domain-containing protein [Nocardioidaceae bacterium]
MTPPNTTPPRTPAPRTPVPRPGPSRTGPVRTGPLSDQGARDRIRDDTDSTLFVDAGAGSGKTKSLIDRVTTLALVDEISLRNIAAVTFTEKAGVELRDRLRAEFESGYRTANSLRRALAAAALDDLDGAAIGTLHSFAQRILTMHPIEAGLPPLIEVLDEVGSSVAFDNRWAVLQRELLDDEALAPAVRLALAAGVKLEHVRSLTRAFQSDWDLIESRVLHEDPAEITLPDLAALVAEALALAARADECSKDDDKFLPRLAAVAAWASDHCAASDPETVIHALSAAGALSFPRHGLAKSWRTTDGVASLDGLRNSCRAWQDKAKAVFGELVNASLRPLARWVAERVRRAARERTAEGRLEFHDLLVVARDLLRENATVRAALQERYPRLLLDEFQDTDPIQIEIAVRIAGAAAADAPSWEDVEVPPGSLFVVGDPKQSIYRFRRADIAMFLRAQECIGTTLTLDANFRTEEPVLRWVNDVFGSVITPAEKAQPSYVALTPTRGDGADGPPVVVLGAAGHDDDPTAAEMREREAADVAAVVRRALDEQWTTYDEHDRAWRTLRLGDIAILVPARTSLPFLEDALDEARIPYRAESSSLVYQAGEVRDLLAAARTVADPSDLLSCVTALRSPLFGCGDDDLWTWKRDRGSFSILAPVPDEKADHPVGRALRYLGRVHRESRWMAPSEVLGAVIADRRMLEVAADGLRARDHWRRLRFVVDQARAWSETEHGGLRAYLAWAARQGEEIARVAEAVLPETDVDAVRVMTVHAAKGLEFPMVVLSGMSSAPRRQGGVRVLWTATGYEVKFTKTVQTNDFDVVAPLDEQMDAYERRRLLYVAATRARDHLVVSLHRKGSGSTNAEILADAGGATATGATVFDPDFQPVRSLATPSASPAELMAWDEWRAAIERIRESTRRVSAISASGLEGTEPAVVLGPDDTVPAGRDKGARDVELPPWSKGRYGSAIGRAVHGVLQSVDLATGAGLDAAVTAQSIAEGVSEHTDVVRDLVRSALDSDVVQRAAGREHWRESYTGMVDDDGILVEGFIDLMYREDDGTLMVVDYKTDAIPAAALAARTEYYAPQVEAYERATSAATGAPVRTTLLFLHPEAPAYAAHR